jgi:predicted HNH restriction endonuclease
MFIKKDFRYLKWVYKAWTKRNRTLVMQLKTGSKKEGENVGKSNIVDYSSPNQRGIEPYNLATRTRIEKTVKAVKEKKIVKRKKKALNSKVDTGRRHMDAAIICEYIIVLLYIIKIIFH